MSTRVLISLLVFLSGLICLGCQSGLNSSAVAINQLQAKFPNSGVEYVEVGDGLMAIDVKLNGQTVSMFLDTGATQSAIFDNKLYALNLEPVSGQVIDIHSLSGRDTRPFSRASQISFGPVNLTNQRLVILPARTYEARSLQVTPAGLIGMDLLRSYKLYHDHERSRIYFLSPEQEIKFAKEPWTRIPLYTSLSGDEGHGLHFLNLKAGVSSIPAMIDTGSEFNVINWSSSRLFADFIVLKQRLRDNWELQGATGTFKPEARAAINNLHGGDKSWPSLPFYIKDLDELKILAVGDDPFIIMGQPFLKDITYLLDFDDRAMWIKLGPEDVSSDKMITYEFRATRIKRPGQR